ncbi:hypothetical protein ACQ4WX_43095 [Streptomyces lasalocidi]
MLAAAVHQYAVTLPESTAGTLSLLVKFDLEDRFSGFAATTGDHFQTLDQTRPR